MKADYQSLNSKFETIKLEKEDMRKEIILNIENIQELNSKNEEMKYKVKSQRQLVHDGKKISKDKSRSFINGNDSKSKIHSMEDIRFMSMI